MDRSDSAEQVVQPHVLRRIVLCITIATIGGLAAAAVAIPLPYMLGAIAATMFAAMAGAPVARPSAAVVTPMRVTLGVLLGSTITPELLENVAAVAGVVATVPFYVVLAAIVGTAYYERVAGYSREEAYYCALPGGLHIMTLYAEERGVDIRRVSLAHALRITFVVVLTTIATSYFVDVPRIAASATTVSIINVNFSDLGVLCAIGVVGWLLGQALRVPGALMVIPMLCSAVAHIAGWTNAKPPVELINAAQVILGANIGSRFVGEGLGILAHAIRHAVCHVSLMLCIAAGFAFALHALLDVPLVTGILSFAPGGMSEIGLIALGLGLDVGFVATAQLSRSVSINLFGPVILRHISWMFK